MVNSKGEATMIEEQLLPKLGQQFAISKTQYEVTYSSIEGIRYAPIKGGEVKNTTAEKFEEISNLINFKYIGPPPSADISISHLTEKQQATMNYRLKYVRYINKHIWKIHSKNEVNALICQVAAQIKDRKPPSFSTVSRWTNKFISSGHNILSLVPESRLQGNRTPRLHPKAEGIITEIISEYYLSDNRYTATQIHQMVQGKLVDMMLDDDLDVKDVYLPSERTINRRIATTDLYQRELHRHGKYKANRKFKASCGQLITERILEVVEADGQLMDLLIIDPSTGEVIGRPYLTAIIDRYSRVILATEITFTPFSVPTVLKAMKSAISTDNGLPGGVFESLVVDNGCDYKSDSLKNFCFNIGVTNIVYAKPKTPNDKPFIESWFDTLNKSLIHRLPGTVFSSPEHRGDYKSSEFSTLSLEQLKDVLKDWLDIYHTNIHSGHGRMPIALWDESRHNCSIFTYSANDVDVIARTLVHKTISDGRIKHLNLKWYSNALSTLEQELKNSGKPAQVDVYVDELDLSCLYIKIPGEKAGFIKAMSTYPDYTEELTAYDHDLISQDLKAKGHKDIAKVGILELIIAKWELWKKVVSFGEEYGVRKIRRITEGNKMTTAEKKIQALIDKIAPESTSIESNDINELNDEIDECLDDNVLTVSKTFIIPHTLIGDSND